MKECDIIINSVINCSEEHVEKVEITLVKDVIETTVWVDEVKSKKMNADNVNNAIQSHEHETPLTEPNADANEQNTNTQDADVAENEADVSNYFDVTEEGDVKALDNQDGGLVAKETKDETAISSNGQKSETHGTSNDTSGYNGDNELPNNDVMEKHENEADVQPSVKIKSEKQLKNEDEDFFIPQKAKDNISAGAKNPQCHLLPRANKHHRKSEVERIVYMHPNFNNFNKITKKYFKFIQRYHIADTLPVYFKGQLQMQLRAAGVNYLTLGLFGPPGAGKSAFLNSLYTAMNGHYVEYSAERKLFGVNHSLKKSATNQRVELRLTETITVLDNRGTDFSKNSMKEVIKQCGE